MAFNVKEVSYYDEHGTAHNALTATDVPIASPIDIKLSENVASSSVLSFSVTLLRTLEDGGNETPVDITLTQPQADIVRIDPTADLIESGHYTVYVPRSTYGLKSENGDTLQKSFSFSFSTVAGSGTAPAPSETEVDIAEQPAIPEELFLVTSTPSVDAVMQYGYGSVIAKFDGRVPSTTTVEVSTRHPLGHSLVHSSLWVANMLEPIVVGSEVYISSKMIYGDLTAEQIANLTVVGSDPITNDSILVLDKTADNDGNVTLDFDPNTLFEITVDIPVNEQSPTVGFMGLLYPFFTTVPETKLEVGPFIEQYNDFTIALAIYRHSITAGQLWQGTTIDPYTPPTRVAEYVMARTKRDILSTFYTDPGGAGAGSLALGDLKLSGKNLTSYLNDSLSALDLKIVALENMLKKGDLSKSPFTDHGHQSLPVQTSGAAFGENWGTDFGSKGFNRNLDKKA
tara:strand:+ start:4549 stop:5913 length:1365 start_codon:yes stop_codon:yes gene_type:complete